MEFKLTTLVSFTTGALLSSVASAQVSLPTPTTVATQTQPSAGTEVNKYPQTALNTDILPVVTTTRASDILKVNILNPFPVCNAYEDRRTIVYKVTDTWLPVGTISATNLTSAPIPLTQTTGKSQTISISVSGEQSSSVSANIGGGVEGNIGEKATANSSWGIAASLARTIGGNAAYSLSWEYGQQIGPYDVPANHTGEATYGFRAINMTGTQQFCKSNGTWSNPTVWMAFVPIKNEVRVNIYEDAADSIDTKAPSVNTTIVAPQPPANVDMTVPSTVPENDLMPRITASRAKSAGFSGYVALRVKNVGTNNYEADKGLTSFLVRVHTKDGEQSSTFGVDRLINPNSFNGAHVQDLGFDRKTSIRTFVVTLANPIYKGEEKLVANFFFGDGLTKVGRIKNFMTVDQLTRVQGDSSFYNDQGINSQTDTTEKYGFKVKGIF